MDLFDGSDDASDAAGEEEGVIGRVGDQLTVNKSYASRFENRKRKQEMAQLRQLHGDLDSEEDASSEDEDGKMLTRELDLKIFKAIDAVRQKRPEVYKPEAAFFDQGEGAEGEDSSGDSDGEGGEKDGAGSSSAKAPKASPTAGRKRSPAQQRSTAPINAGAASSSLANAPSTAWIKSARTSST